MGLSGISHLRNFICSVLTQLQKICGFTVKYPRDSRDTLLVCGQQAAEFKSEWKIKHMALSPGLLFLSGWGRISHDSSFLLTLTSSKSPAWSNLGAFPLTTPSSLPNAAASWLNTWTFHCPPSFQTQVLENFPSYGLFPNQLIFLSATSSVLLKQRFQRIRGPPNTPGKSEVQWSNHVRNATYHISFLQDHFRKLKVLRRLTVKIPT